MPTSIEMDQLIDFLRFRAFVSPVALIVFYYLGAIVMPGAAWLFLLWLRRHWPLLGQVVEDGRRIAVSMTRRRERLLMLGIFVACFLFMELMWRMMFEYLIAFLQMREALIQIQETAPLF